MPKLRPNLVAIEITVLVRGSGPKLSRTEYTYVEATGARLCRILAELELARLAELGSVEEVSFDPHCIVIQRGL
ncbi:hypothetical protein Tiera_054 [Polaromonas phage Tiera]|nr:hypothetical protein Tiera_054 [Polaromonas phage Tiera]